MQSAEIKYHKLQNIEPFNSFVFKNCYYNALFSIMNYYSISKIPIILNSSPRYYFDKELNQFGIEYIDLNEIDQMLGKLGMKKERVTNSFDQIVKVLDKGIAIISGVDWFYMPHQRDTYMKKHKDHVIVIVGYCKENESLLIFDQEKVDSLNYREVVIDRETFEKATIWCDMYSLDVQPQATLIDNLYLRECLENEYLDLEQFKENRIEVLDEFKSNLNSLLDEKKILSKEHCEQVMFGFNMIINHKVVECSLFKELYSSEHRDAKKCKSTLEVWKKCRSSIYKSFLRKGISKIELIELKKYFDEIILLESQISRIA